MKTTKSRAVTRGADGCGGAGRRVPRWLATASLLAALPLSPSVAPVVRAASPEPLAASDAMVVTECPDASAVGAIILRRGGNAIDAAIATHFALAVAHPEAGNLGGGGFMLIRMADGTREAVDFRETAPGAATRNLFLGQDGLPDPVLSTGTLLGTGVPGSVAGMALAHERYGTLSWRDLLAPAIHLAGDGFPVDRSLAEALRASAERLGKDPEARRVLLRDGAFWQEGDTLRQPELAATLERLASRGPREFYEGATADSLLAEMTRGGGIITAEDLRRYRPAVREPLSGSYRGYTVVTMPPPSSGGVALLQMLGMLQRRAPVQEAPGSSREIHLLAEVMRRAFADRAEFLGDPDFTPLPVAGLLDSAYVDSLAAGIALDAATPSTLAGPGYPHGAPEFYSVTGDTPGAGLLDPGSGAEGTETTHFSIVDGEGNAVAVTTTLNTSFGTGIMVRGAGFLLNNEMDDFAAAPGTPNYYGLIQGEANAVRPFARPLSSMVPTIVLRGDTLALVLGSPGGPRIITAVLQTIVNVIDHGWDLQRAVDAPRVHHQWWPDRLYLEPEARIADVMENLAAMGHVLGAIPAVGSVQAIRRVGLPAGGWMLYGASDARRNGCAVGLSGGRWVSNCSCRPDGFMEGSDAKR